MEITAFLSLIESFEEEMSQLYDRYSRKLKNDPEAAAFFQRLSTEETQHRAKVRDARHQAAHHLKLDDIRLPLDPERLEEALRKVKAVLVEGAPDGLAEMLTRAFWLEQFALERHSLKLLSPVPPVALLLASLRSGDRDHVRVVADFARSRGVELEPSAGAEASPEKG